MKAFAVAKGFLQDLCDPITMVAWPKYQQVCILQSRHDSLREAQLIGSFFLLIFEYRVKFVHKGVM